MMKNFKRLFTFLLLVVMTVSMAFSACGTPSADNGSSSTSDNEITSSSDTEESSREETLAETKEKGVEAIDTYMQEIRDMDLEYSLVLIEREAEQGKQAIEGAEDKTQATALKEETLNAMKALVLTDEEALAIKQAYRIKKERPTARAALQWYLGQYEEKHVFVICNDYPQIEPITIGEYDFYFMLTGTIYVYVQDKVYSLREAYGQDIVTAVEVGKIHHDYGYMCINDKL